MNDTRPDRQEHAHLNSRFDAELRELKSRVLNMGHLVDAQVAAAVDAFVRRDRELAQRTADDDRLVNDLEREIDERCVQLLALQQPAASDLRFIAAVLKIVTDLERIGDFAVNIAETVATLDDARLHAERDLVALAGAALTVLRRALDAFVQRNVAEARALATADSAIDTRALRLGEEARAAIHGDSQCLTNALALLSATKHLERVAGHAINLAEMAIYTERGEDVRHRPLAEPHS